MAIPGPVRLPTADRTLVLGVVNVTPDSFSDGGQWWTPEEAVAHGARLRAEGADLLDVGGESTRPGAARPTVAEELRRVLPVVRELAASGAVVSIDTMRADVATQALDAGATVVNDVSGGLADPEMLALVAERRVPYVCMHWRGHAGSMQDRAVYRDVVGEVIAELADRVAAAEAAGVSRQQLVIDPGFGFAKTAEHNWELLRRLTAFDLLALPLLVGVSRKSFLGALLARDGPRPPRDRDDATTALTTIAAQARVWGVRVHAVRPARDAIAVVERLRSTPVATGSTVEWRQFPSAR